MMNYYFPSLNFLHFYNDLYYCKSEHRFINCNVRNIRLILYLFDKIREYKTIDHMFKL